ncbi:hypothetical protein ACQJBY_007545 [Aegilops geniculata]
MVWSWYYVDSEGARLKGSSRFYSSLYAYGILDEGYKFNMSVEEAVELAWRAFITHYSVTELVVAVFLVLRFHSGVVRIRLTTSVCLLHGLVLLPSGISGKMTIPSKSLLSLLARCSLFCYVYATMPSTCLSCLPYCHVKPLTILS